MSEKGSGEMEGETRPAYADFDAPAKFTAIQSIIGKRLYEHPNAYCSYSGGSDSDILLDLIENARKLFGLPPIKYVFFNTGLEMEATKEHVKAQTEKYGIEIETVRPKKSIVTACREKGIPIFSKIASQRFEAWQRSNFPITAVDEYEEAADKPKKFRELKERYDISGDVMSFLLSANFKTGEPAVKQSQTFINSIPYLVDFLHDNPLDFKVSAKCCGTCKKQPAHEVNKHFEMAITGEREAEGGARAAYVKPLDIESGETRCFFYTKKNDIFRLRPI